MDKTSRRVMVAIDGSNESDLAFKRAVENVTNDDELIIAHIIDTRSLQAFPDFEKTINEQKHLDQSLDLAQNTLDEYESRAKDKGITNTTTVLKYGTPKIEISESLPDEYDIDLLYLGATGLNAVERIFIGSVSEYVVRHAPCDVLITRRNEHQ